MSLAGKSSGFRWFLPAAACALVLGLFAWMARCTQTYGRPNPAEHNYNLLVRGFQSGQLNLKRTVPVGFAQLADPFDPAANKIYRKPPYWLHDLSYYRGKLYLYFGPTPALLLFWPYAVLTGRYLSHPSAVAVFCAIAFLASAGLLLGLWRRFFPEVGAAVAAAGALALGLTTGMPIILQRGEFYEVAVSCGSALSLLALAGVWLAVDQPARRGRWLAAASLAYGLAIGARPSVLFGAAILLVPVVFSVRERIRAGSPPKPWNLLAAAVLPLTFCGLALLLYNDLRFGRPLEFGERYQLAAERVAHLRFFSPGYLWFNFRVYFLEPVRWSRFFPFAGDISSLSPPPGHAQVESGGGVLTNIPVLWLALAAPLGWRARSGPERTELRALIASVALSFGACALVLCLFIGNAWRYEVEFLPALALLATIGIFGLERALAGRPALRIAVRVGWSLPLAASIAFNLLESVDRHADHVVESAQSLIDEGHASEGIARLEQALRLRSDYPEAHYNLGNVWSKAPGRLLDAIAQYQEALRLRPDFVDAHYNLGDLWLNLPGHLPDAIAQYQEALRLEPDYAEAHNNLGIAWSMTPGRRNDAVAEFKAALRLDPNYADAHYNLGNLWLSLPGHLNDAIAQYEEALRLKPDFAGAHNNLGNALSLAPGRRNEAIAHYEAALRLNPDFADAHYDLAVVLLKIPGRGDEAKAHLQAVLRLQPENARARQLLAGIRSSRP